jgi:hypothetical protein
MRALSPGTCIPPHRYRWVSAHAFASTTRLIASISIALGALGACSSGERSSADTAAAATGQEATGAAATGVADGEFMSDRDIDALANYRLNDDRIAKLERGVQNLTELNRTDPAVMDRIELQNESQGANQQFSIDKFVSDVESEPKLRRAVESSGMSVRDFLLSYFSVAFAQNQLSQPQGAQSLPDTAALPPEARAAVRQLQRMTERMKRAIPEQTVDYVRRNEARIERLMQAMRQIERDNDGQASDTTGG